jgi:hypothetical protein
VSIAITSAPRLGRWLVVVTLALGLMAMHHLVDTPAHPGSCQDSSLGMTMLPDDHDGGTLTDGVAGPAPGTDCGLMLHLCQAVLIGLVLLAAVALTRRLGHRSEAALSGAGLGPDASRQRAPPLPLQLAQIGVLRL